jgi:hypothetical protein
VSRVVAVARATAVELLRRRVVVALMVVVPLAFYAARHDLTGQSIRFAAIGMTWALSTLAAFAGLAGQAIDARLRLSGYRGGELLAGRVLGLCALTVPLVAGYVTVILVDRELERWAGLVLAFGLVLVVALPFGLFAAALLHRPLEAAMLLLVVSGLQMMLDPAGFGARLLPFWSVREVLTWTVDGVGGDHLGRALLHAGASVAVLGGAAVALRAQALRRRPHVLHLPVPGGG